jgi:hypothetical protein
LNILIVIFGLINLIWMIYVACGIHDINKQLGLIRKSNKWLADDE